MIYIIYSTVKQTFHRHLYVLSRSYFTLLAIRLFELSGVVLKGGSKPSGEVPKTLATSMSDASTCVTCEGLTAPFSPLIILDVIRKSSAFIL